MPRTAIDFHHLAVHFAVGLLMFAPLLQLVAAWKKNPALLLAARSCLFGGGAAAVVAALTGFAASSEFRHRLLETHEILGFVTAGCAAVLVGLSLWKPVAEPRSRSGLLVLGGLCLAAGLAGGTGYVGGAMAHGHGVRGPLAGVSAASSEVVPPELAAAHAVFASKCSMCHAAQKALDANVPADQWPAVVGKMAARSDGEITPADQEQIVRFLQSRAAAR